MTGPRMDRATDLRVIPLAPARDGRAMSAPAASPRHTDFRAAGVCAGIKAKSNLSCSDFFSLSPMLRRYLVERLRVGAGFDAGLTSLINSLTTAFPDKAVQVFQPSVDRKRSSAG